MATGNQSNQPIWLTTLISSIEGMKEDVSDLKDDVREMRGDVREVRSDVAGKDGLRERVTTLESTACILQKTVEGLVETLGELAGRESTPISIVHTKKSSIKDHGMTAGVTGIVFAVLEIASQFMKTK